MPHQKFNKRGSGKRSRKRNQATGGSGGGRGTPFSQVALLGRENDTKVARRGADRPSDYGGTMVVFSEASQVPRPFIPVSREYKIRQAVNTFNASAGLSSPGAFPYFQAANTGNTFPTIAFQFDDLAQVASLAAIFDQYRIDMVEMIIKPSNAVVDLHSAAAPNQVNPQVYAVLDFDDATALASIAAAQQYDNNVVFMGSEGVHIRVVPAVTPSLYQGGAFSGYGVRGPMWIDCNSQTVDHYGIKFVVEGLQATSTELYQWNIQCWYHLSFRNVR